MRVDVKHRTILLKQAEEQCALVHVLKIPSLVYCRMTSNDDSERSITTLIEEQHTRSKEREKQIEQMAMWMADVENDKDARFWDKYTQAQLKVTDIDKRITSVNRIIQERVHNQEFLSSTMLDRSNSLLSDSVTKTMTDSSNVLSKTLMKIDECKPEGGLTSITALVFRRWKTSLQSLMETGPILSQTEKANLFRRCAGSLLLNKLQLLTQDIDEKSLTPYDDIIKVLDEYFNSAVNKRQAKMELKASYQKADETNLIFIDRLMTAALNCGFTKDEFDEQLMDVIAKNSNDKKIREKALLTDKAGKRPSYSEIRNEALNIATVKANEKMHGNKQMKDLPVEAYTVKSGESSMGQQRSSMGQQRSSYAPASQRWMSPRDPARLQEDRYRDKSLGNLSKNQTCNRCATAGHDSENCPHRHKICHGCNKTGHLRRACRSGATSSGHSFKVKTSTSAKKQRVNSLNDSVKEPKYEVSTSGTSEED